MSVTTGALTTAIPRGSRLVIEVDYEDAEATPALPLTLNADMVSANSSTHVSIGGEECMIGNDLPTMLRELADRIERGQVSA